MTQTITSSLAIAAIAACVLAPTQITAQTLAAKSSGVARYDSGKQVAVPAVKLRGRQQRALSRSTTFKAASGAEEYVCLGIVCFCVGDDDCNDLFTAECADPSTGGSCTEVGGETVCSCTPNGS